MPQHFVQQMLTYEDNQEAIEVLGTAIDQLGKQHDPAAALETLMRYRDHLMACQRPVLKQYDPREDRPVHLR